jgi:arsenate reductase
VPDLSGVAQRLRWLFPDPSKVAGTHEERMERVREIRNQIRRKVEQFCDEHCAVESQR